jgi:hypothetical protein
VLRLRIFSAEQPLEGAEEGMVGGPVEHREGRVGEHAVDMRPIRAVPRKDFGFKIVVRVVEDGVP